MEKKILRAFQASALQLLKNHKKIHLICISPTGSGKSLIFQEYAKDPSVRMLVVSPLVALSRQHTRNLEVESDQSRFKILSPESLFQDLRPFGQYEKIKRWKPNFLVVDECHCLWDWGRNFRTSFQLLPSLLKTFGIHKSLWLTATLPINARNLLEEQLPRPIKRMGHFQLPRELNLRFLEVPWSERMEAILSIVTEQKAPGIIFANTRTMATRIRNLLQGVGISTFIYHAGLSEEERLAVENEIHAHRARVVIATSAFGMGMNFTHFRWLILSQAPLTLLGMAQTLGRIGRNHQEGRAYVLWHRDDFHMNEWALRDESLREEFMHVLNYLNSNECRQRGLERYFEGEPRSDKCASCDYCAVSGSGSGSLKNDAIL